VRARPLFFFFDFFFFTNQIGPTNLGLSGASLSELIRYQRAWPDKHQAMSDRERSVLETRIARRLLPTAIGQHFLFSFFF
jgi:hypothetical protein